MLCSARVSLGSPSLGEILLDIRGSRHTFERHVLHSSSRKYYLDIRGSWSTFGSHSLHSCSKYYLDIRESRSTFERHGWHCSQEILLGHQGKLVHIRTPQPVCTAVERREVMVLCVRTRFFFSETEDGELGNNPHRHQHYQI